MKVITWSDPAHRLGAGYDCCPTCEARHEARGDWPSRYSQVSHGLHEGICKSPHHAGVARAAEIVADQILLEE